MTNSSQPQLQHAPDSKSRGKETKGMKNYTEEINVE